MSGRILATALLVALAAAVIGNAAAAASAADRCRDEARLGHVGACQAALVEKPGDVALRRHLALAQLVAGDEDGSLMTWQDIARERPDDAEAQFDYGMILITLRQFEAGAGVLDRTMALDPDHRDAHFAAGLINAQLGRREAAFVAIRRAAELGSELAMFELSEYYRLGYGTAIDRVEAFRWLEAAAETGHVLAMEMLVETYLAGGYDIAPDDSLAEEWARRARDERSRLPDPE